MSGGVEWAFQMLDRASGPASTAEKKLALLEKRIASLRKAEAALNDPRKKENLAFSRMGLEIQRDGLVAQEKAAAAAGNWIAKLDHGLGIVQKIGGALLGVASSIGHAVIGFGEMAVDAAAAKEEQFLVFRNLLKSSEAAKEFMGDLEEISFRSSLTGDEVGGFGRKLFSAGFRRDEALTLVRAFSDLAANGASAEKLDAAADALRKIRMEGVLSAKSLNVLTAAGIPADAVYARLSKQLGVTADRARELVKAGKVSAGQGLFAAVGGVLDSRSGGELGAAGARVVGESAGLMMRKVKARWENFFEDLYETKGFGAFKGFLSNVLSALDTTSATGKRIAESIGSAFDRVFVGLFGELSGPDGLENVERLVRKVANAVEGLGVGVGAVARGFVTGLKPILGDVSDLLDGPMTEDKIAKIDASFAQLGQDIGTVTSAVIQLVSALADLIRTVSGQANWDTNDFFGRVGAINESRHAKAGKWTSRLLDATGIGGMTDALGAMQASPERAGELLAEARGVAPVPPTISFDSGQALASFAPSQQIEANYSISIDATGADERSAAAVKRAANEGVRDAHAAMLSSVAMSRGGI